MDSNPRSASSTRRRGFTLVEMMVVLLIMGMAMSLAFGVGDSLLPRTRLRAGAREITRALEKARLHAIVTQQAVVFAYDLSANVVHAFYPQERDDSGEIVGPGRTVVLDPIELPKTIQLFQVVLADGTLREEGEVLFSITPLGRIAPHEVVVRNPDYPETEIRTVRIDGMTNTTAILEGRPEREVLDDVDFR